MCTSSEYSSQQTCTASSDCFRLVTEISLSVQILSTKKIQLNKNNHYSEKGYPAPLMTACQSIGPHAAEAINCWVQFYTVIVLRPLADMQSLALHIGNAGEVIVGSLPLQLMETRVRKNTSSLLNSWQRATKNNSKTALFSCHNCLFLRRCKCARTCIF